MVGKGDKKTKISRKKNPNCLAHRRKKEKNLVAITIILAQYLGLGEKVFFTKGVHGMKQEENKCLKMDDISFLHRI